MGGTLGELSTYINDSAINPKSRIMVKRKIRAFTAPVFPETIHLS